MRFSKLFSIVTVITMVGAVSAYAQMGGGMMGAQMSGDTARMMQEPNKALAQASIQYMIVFARTLHTQSTQRKDQIDGDFIASAFSEMKRAYEMINRSQATHVRTMDEKMQSKVAPMMERMNRSLATVKKHLDILEKEVNNGRDLGRISLLTSEILKALEEIPGGRMGSMGK